MILITFMTGCSLTRLKDEHRSRASLIQGRIWQLPIGRACPSPDFSFVLTNVPALSGSFITGAERRLLKQESLWGGGSFIVSFLLMSSIVLDRYQPWRTFLELVDLRSLNLERSPEETEHEGWKGVDRVPAGLDLCIHGSGGNGVGQKP